MKKILLILFLIPALALKGQILQMDLQQCLQYAEEHNQDLQSGKLDVQTSDIQLKQAKLRQYPTVSAGIGQNFGYSHGSESFGINGNYSLNAGIDIFKGLTIRNTIKQSQVQADQTEMQVEQVRNGIRIEIIRCYLTILMNQELIEYRRTVLNTSREQVKQGRQRYESGRILESDYKLLQAQYLSDSMSIENTQIAIDNEYINLRNLITIPDDQHQFVIITPDSSRLAQSMQVPDMQNVLQQALNYLPELKVKEKAVEIAEYDVKIAKGGYYPSITASAGIGTGYNASYGNDQSGLTSGLYKGLNESVGLNINIPIYQQGSIRNTVKIREIQLEKAKLALEIAEGDVIEQVQEYYLNVKKAYNDYQLSELQQEAYYLNYQTYNQKFQLGAITAVDLLQQQTNYLNILNNYMQNKYNFLLQKKVLDVYTGQPVTL